ncbi:unnamed protein product [Soboliphyme baturini]|uniref:APOBEC_N domain-containing protein n=1 Tax=Soboliphyme baturini TaxID=241478 RepID=A0A183IJ21_9BILA|nr:unnamed protein product [Soboliphyme baturini]
MNTRRSSALVVTTNSCAQPAACCGCPSTLRGRCLRDDHCVCKAAHRFCRDDCESAKGHKDCLNVELCRCQCKADPGHASAGRQQLSSKSSTAATAMSCSSHACRCFQNDQACHSECLCGQRCANGEITNAGAGQHRSTIGNHSKPVDYAQLHCKCRSGKRRCSDRVKCPCRLAFKLCTSACKCREWCSNANRRACITGSCKSFFLDPERGASKTMVACLRTTTNGTYYQEYRATDNDKDKDSRHPEEIFHKDMLQALRTYVLPLTHIIVYLPTSPCFHQDCEPQCDVLDRCSSNRACAEQLAIVYRQAKLLTEKTDLKMSVKFLASYIRRGDLYTKQGITMMMNAGIDVEPLGMRDWIELVHNDNDNLAESTINDYYFSLWKGLRLTSYIRQSEIYINECRAANGLKNIYWFSCLHNLIRDCLTTSARTYAEYVCLDNCLKTSKCDRHPVIKRGCQRTQSDTTIYDNSTTIGSDIPCTREKTTTPTTVASVADSETATDPEVKISPVGRHRKHKSLSRISSVMRRRNKRKEYTSHESFSESSVELNSADTTPHFENTFEESVVSRLLVDLYSRSIDDTEFEDVKKDIRLAVEDIRDRLQKFLNYVKSTIDSTSSSSSS